MVDKQANVIVVAPLAPGFPSAHLGAEKKIELVLMLLHRLGYNVHLVDSSHPVLEFKTSVSGISSFVGATPVTLWRPFCLPSRKLGKLLNVVFSGLFLRRLRSLSPAFVWVYNSYSFEACAALYLKRRTNTKIILELEDLPLARSRSFNPKPWLDQWFFPRLLAVADLVTYVNAAIQRKYAAQSRRAMLLPSLLQQALVDAPSRIRFTDAICRVGYFGGLEIEKGAGILLDAVQALPKGWKLVVTGVGSLSQEFEAAQQMHPDRLEFHGRVPHATVVSLMLSCDAIANPHTPIALMNEGVFPFKVCEALASGALLVSTALPSIDIDLSHSVVAFDGSVDGFLESLSTAPAFYAENVNAIHTTCAAIRTSYSEDAVFLQLRTVLEAVLASK
jgi:glycosyltransferase involved in cell wall biosynthesis